MGAYKLPTRDTLVSSDGTSMLPRSRTNLTELPTEISPRIAEARQFEERLNRGTENGTFIAMTVEPRGYLPAVSELDGRFPIQVIDIESELIKQLRSIADSKKVKWEAILAADMPGSEHRERLMKLVRLAMPKVEQSILSADRLVLLTYSGLLARFDQMDILTRLRDKVGRSRWHPGTVDVDRHRRTILSADHGRQTHPRHRSRRMGSHPRQLAQERASEAVSFQRLVRRRAMR